MANQITSPRHNDEPQAKPTYTPNYWERKHGKVINGVFHKPNFVVMRNGKYIELNGSTVSAYSYKDAYHIMLHLQAISDDEYTIQPCSWLAMTDYNVLLDDEVSA